MRSRVPMLALLACTGCTDIFALPIGGGGGGDQSQPGDGGTDDAFVDLDGDTDAGDDGGSDGPLALPASCAMLACTPAMNEGDVTLSGDVMGWHAYARRTIEPLSDVTAKRDPVSGLGFAACADVVLIAGVLEANGEGENESSGPGAGKVCGSGGGHGGAGADPGSCGGGGPYGDMMLPRTLGSGGGGISSSGGKGGGSIELEADQIMLLGFINADGDPGSGARSGGGSGGSILLRATTIDGAGQVNARGGLGLGLAGGGGGGGRVAIYDGSANPNLKTDVKGGSTMNGSADGIAGTVYRFP